MRSIAQTARKMKWLAWVGVVGMAGAAEPRWGEVTLGGGACSRGAVQKQWDPSQNLLRIILPPDFNTGTRAGERAVCLLSVPVAMPPGLKLVWRGVELEKKGASEGDGVVVTLSAQGNPPWTKVWEGREVSSHILKFDTANALVGCGAGGLVRLNLSTRLSKARSVSVKFVAVRAKFAVIACN